jgi:hypothetical protein
MAGPREAACGISEGKMRNFKGWGCAYLALVLSISVRATPQHAGSSTTIQAAGTSALVAPTAEAKVTGESPAAKLPIRRVVLYKTGIGYFEHLGRVEDDQRVRIDFTSGQLNDVLESLTILDLNGGRIAGVSYNSEAPLSQRLGALRLPFEEATDASKFYAALRGTRLEVKNGTNSITGRLLSVERKTRVSGGTTLEVDVITLVSDAGQVRSVEITPAVSVRLAEHDVNEEVGRYLGLLRSASEQDLRRMTIETSGSGHRQLYVSYISEVPVWKTTYRIVLPSKMADDTLLQGWAIVDNTVGEDWSNVELSLVAGAPQSFIQPLSQPFYTRRPVIALTEIAQQAPQTHEAAMLGGLGRLSGLVTDPTGGVMPFVEVKVYGEDGTLRATATTDDRGQYAIADLPAGNYRAEFRAQGFNTAVVEGLSLGGGRDVAQNMTLKIGSVNETVTVAAQLPTVETAASTVGVAGGAGPRTGSNSELGRGPATGASFGMGAAIGPGVPGGVLGGRVLNAARGAADAVAHGADLGDLFEYKLKDRVTIRKNESALVPIVQVHVTAEKVSLWNASLHSMRPLRALWLTNSSSLTLDGGSFSILENDAFAGEGLTDSIKAGEKRLLSYAADLGLRVESRSEGDPERVTHVRVDRGVMTQMCELRQATTYIVRDDDTTPRTVLIEHPLRTGWRLAGENSKPEETTSAVYRFRIQVDPKNSATFVVHESRPLESTYQLTNLTEDQIKIFLQQRAINPEIEAAFRKIVEQKNRVAAFDAEISNRDDERQKIYDDQQRLRENLKALKGSAEERALTQRYTQQLADQETRLETLERESAALENKRDTAQGELEQMIQTLSLDRTI